MIDRAARDRAHRVLERFVNGITTCDEFESEFGDGKSTDRAIWAIETMAWNFYDDNRVGRLTGRQVLSAEGRERMERMLIFLRSDVEYRWPVDNFIRTGAPCGLLNVLTFGWSGRRFWRRDAAFVAQLHAAGDFSAWPFLSHEEYARTARAPGTATEGTGRNGG